MTVKDEKLYVGGIVMEYVLPNGAIASEGGKFVKVISHTGIHHVIWFVRYKSDNDFRLFFSVKGDLHERRFRDK